MDIKTADVVLCEFYFSDLKASKNRPVLVLKNNLPYDDFVGLPISSQLDKLHEGEVEIDNSMFQFGGIPKIENNYSEAVCDFKNVVIKKYGSLNQSDFEKYHRLFCQYFGCDCV